MSPTDLHYKTTSDGRSGELYQFYKGKIIPHKTFSQNITTGNIGPFILGWQYYDLKNEMSRKKHFKPISFITMTQKSLQILVN